jgi:hypothetical protein
MFISKVPYYGHFRLNRIIVQITNKFLIISTIYFSKLKRRIKSYYVGQFQSNMLRETALSNAY